MAAINLSEYSFSMRRHLRAVGACAVVVAGRDESGPLTVAVTSDPPRRFVETPVFYCLWTPGKPVAQLIGRRVCADLIASGRDAGDGRFAADLSSLAGLIERAAKTLYPATPCLTHAQLLAILPDKSGRSRVQHAKMAN